MNTTIEIESTPFDQPELTNTPASDQPDHIHLDLWLWDADLVQPLMRSLCLRLPEDKRLAA